MGLKAKQLQRFKVVRLMPVPVTVAPRWSEIGQPDVVHESSDELHQPNRISRSGRSRSTTPPASRPMTPPGEPQAPLLLPVPDTPHSATGSFASEVEELTAQRQSIKFEAGRLE